MRNVHLAIAALAVLAAGVVLGSGVAGYAEFPGNQPCFSSMLSQLEGKGGEDAYSLVPFGTRCEASDGTTVESFGPGVPAWIAWMVAMTALVAAAVRRPGSARAAGALAAAVMLAVLGVASHGGTDFIFTMWMGMILGGPLAFVTLHLLLPVDRRSRVGSFCLATLLSLVVFFVATAFAFSGNVWGHVGVALALALGAAIGGYGRAVSLPRWLVGDQVA